MKFDKERTQEIISLLLRAEQAVNELKPKVDSGGACLLCQSNTHGHSCDYCDLAMELFIAASNLDYCLCCSECGDMVCSNCPQTCCDPNE